MGVAPCEIWKSLSKKLSLVEARLIWEFSLVEIERQSRFQSADKRNAVSDRWLS